MVPKRYEGCDWSDRSIFQSRACGSCVSLFPEAFELLQERNKNEVKMQIEKKEIYLFIKLDSRWKEDELNKEIAKVR